ncbi:MAG: hypothetical protein ACM3QW_01800 [Ignavibacteriales bacterium]
MFKTNFYGKAKPWLAVILVAVILLAGAGSALAFGNGAGTGQGLGIGRTIGSLADQVASFLGISRQDLASDRQAGKSLADIAASKNVSQTELTDKMLETRMAALKQALADGKITQAQYDTCVQNMKQNIEKNVTRTTVGPNGNGQGRGQGNGQGRRGQMGNGGRMGCGQCLLTTSN